MKSILKILFADEEKPVPSDPGEWSKARIAQLRELLTGTNELLDGATAALTAFRSEHMAFAGLRGGLVFVSDNVRARQELEIQLRALTKERDSIITQRSAILSELASLTVR